MRLEAPTAPFTSPPSPPAPEPALLDAPASEAVEPASPAVPAAEDVGSEAQVVVQRSIEVLRVYGEATAAAAQHLCDIATVDTRLRGALEAEVAQLQVVRTERERILGEVETLRRERDVLRVELERLVEVGLARRRQVALEVERLEQRTQELLTQLRAISQDASGPAGQPPAPGPGPPVPAQTTPEPEPGPGASTVADPAGRSSQPRDARPSLQIPRPAAPPPATAAVAAETPATPDPLPWLARVRSRRLVFGGLTIAALALAGAVYPHLTLS